MADALRPLMIHREEIAALCGRFGVIRLEVFGSAVSGGFDSARSDYDFLVQFDPGADLGPWLSRYFEFKNSLEQMLGRPIDLVQIGAPANQHFWNQVEQSRRIVYAA